MQFVNHRNALITNVVPKDGILKERIEVGRTATIPSSLRKCYETGRIDAFKLNWTKGMPHHPHIYWDSDVAKVLEGMANMLAIHPDSAMEAEYDSMVELIASAQQPDGYLNSYFSGIVPGERWTNLAYNHELYCAGHLIEAAVAGYQLLGKRKFLDVVCRYADCIAGTFGRNDGQMRGYPGHEEIELALVRLYEATGERRYFDLAKYFIDERGQTPNYFAEVEKTMPPELCETRQAEKPVREQNDAHGHAVRAVYLYCGMIDVARISGDEELFYACRRIFENIVTRRMYITGGIGSTFFRESFTVDYDLPNGSCMYAESCAAMGLVRLASRLLNVSGDGHYAEIMEKVLFNGALAGISLSGDKFFYTNYLEVDENTKPYNHGARERQKWFECSCCPTSFCRFLPESLQYIWSETDGEIRLNIPIANTYNSPLGPVEVRSRYPYDGNIRVEIKFSGKISLSVRIPEWCSRYSCRLNGERLPLETVCGYLTIARFWNSGDIFEYALDMPVKVMHSNFKITGNAGRIALMRGPLVYACESADNPDGISNMIIPTQQQFELKPAADLPDGTLAVTGKAFVECADDNEALYYSGELHRKPVGFTAIPYFLWQNRGTGNMAVWIRTE